MILFRLSSFGFRRPSASSADQWPSWLALPVDLLSYETSQCAQSRRHCNGYASSWLVTPVDLLSYEASQCARSRRHCNGYALSWLGMPVDLLSYEASQCAQSRRHCNGYASSWLWVMMWAFAPGIVIAGSSQVTRKWPFESGRIRQLHRRGRHIIDPYLLRKLHIGGHTHHDRRALLLPESRVAYADSGISWIGIW